MAVGGLHFTTPSGGSWWETVDTIKEKFSKIQTFCKLLDIFSQLNTSLCENLQNTKCRDDRGLRQCTNFGQQSRYGSEVPGFSK